MVDLVRGGSNILITQPFKIFGMADSVWAMGWGTLISSAWSTTTHGLASLGLYAAYRYLDEDFIAFSREKIL